MFSNRLGITLAILLTLIFFTKERPKVIETLPYATVHDEGEKWLVGFVILLGLENLLVFVGCFGVYGPDRQFEMEVINGNVQDSSQAGSSQVVNNHNQLGSSQLGSSQVIHNLVQEQGEGFQSEFPGATLFEQEYTMSKIFCQEGTILSMIVADEIALVLL